MKCSKCHAENLESAKFCGECRTPFEKVCSNCQHPNPLQFKFCSECGHSLRVPSKEAPRELYFDEKLAKIQRYLPEGLNEKILSQRNKIEGEHKQVTVMFCDMVGFTSLSEKLGAENIYSIIDEVCDILIHKVHEYEGTVNQITGDGVMALFGAPIALEDAPQRAIRSSLAIHKEITKFSERMEREIGLLPIKIRAGIHTGSVVMGTLGNDLRVKFTAVGDTVNLASRMEGLAEPGTTYVTEDTFKLTVGLFRFEALGEKQVKGKEEPVKVYQVIAPSTLRTRFDVSAERGLTPFIGRERELELLLDGFERAKTGKGQAFSIVSEAGAGKSRLLYEFRKAVANQDMTFLEGRCLSYSRSIAYHPLIDILKSNFDIHEEEGDQEIREKVKKGLILMGVDEPSTLPYLLELLLVKDSGIDQISMSPEAKKDRIIEAIKRIVLKGSEMRPLILAIEDLHWLDKSSEDVAKDLLESIPASKILLIFTYRPEFVHTWGAKSYYSQLNLHRLSNRESLEMVNHILGTKKIGSTLEKLILEKTEGIPFFIEEFIKSFKDLKIIDRKENAYHLSKEIERVVIPSTMQDVIMARVDSLPEKGKEVLQTGSVIEREFSYPLIKRVAGLPDQELLSCLSVLKDSELLYERGIYPQSNYVFKHALTRDVVYDSILTKRKKKLHEEIGDAIEELCKDGLREHYEVLSEHYFLGENYLKSAEYSRLASRKSEKAASLNDAITYSKKRVACLERLRRTETVEKQIIDARVVLGLHLHQMYYHTEAREAIDPVIDLAMKHKNQKRLSQIHTVMGTYHFIVKEDYPKAFEAYEDALRASEEAKDVITLVIASLGIGSAFGWNCEFEKSENYLQKALNINVTANNLWGIAVAKSILAHNLFYPAGRINLQFKTTDEALRIAEESGDIFSKAHTYVMHGISYCAKGLPAEAQNHLLKGAEFCERIDLQMWNALAQLHLGETYFEMGDFLRSEEHYKRLISVLENARLLPSLAGFGQVGVARSKVMNKDKEVNLESLYNHSRNNKIKVFEGLISKYIGEILLNLDDPEISKAEQWIQKAIESDQRNGMMFHLAKDHASYANAFKRKGQMPEARENLGKAIEILKDCGAAGWVKKYEDELASLC
jgi:class 3 adenylate cyclase/tetratricopeptide (TPR) repeat protein